MLAPAARRSPGAAPGAGGERGRQLPGQSGARTVPARPPRRGRCTGTAPTGTAPTAAAPAAPTATASTALSPHTPHRSLHERKGSAQRAPALHGLHCTPEGTALPAALPAALHPLPAALPPLPTALPAALHSVPAALPAAPAAHQATHCNAQCTHCRVPHRTRCTHRKVQHCTLRDTAHALHRTSSHAPAAPAATPARSPALHTPCNTPVTTHAARPVRAATLVATLHALQHARHSRTLSHTPNTVRRRNRCAATRVQQTPRRHCGARCSPATAVPIAHHGARCSAHAAVRSHTAACWEVQGWHGATGERGQLCCVAGLAPGRVSGCGGRLVLGHPRPPWPSRW